jgi:hypothetical protein
MNEWQLAGSSIDAVNDDNWAKADARAMLWRYLKSSMIA